MSINKIRNILNEYIVEDLSNIILEYALTNYQIEKSYIFDNMWECVKIHREIINNQESIEECTKIEEKFDKHLQEILFNKEKCTIKQLDRDLSYLLRVAIKNDMYKYLNHNFKVPINGIIRCGKCGEKNHCSNLRLSCNSSKYKYECFVCTDKSNYRYLYGKKSSIEKYLKLLG